MPICFRFRAGFLLSAFCFRMTGVAQRVRERAGRGPGVVHPPAHQPHVAHQAGPAVAPRRRATSLHQGMVTVRTTSPEEEVVLKRRALLLKRRSRASSAQCNARFTPDLSRSGLRCRTTTSPL